MDKFVTPYQQRLNLQGATFQRIDHDDAMVAVVYRVTQPDGTQLILKICTLARHYQREAYFLQYFAGVLPVPCIVNVVPPEPDVNGAILMEFVPGVLLKIADYTDALAYEVGVTLARIHLNHVAGYGDLTEPQSLTSDPRAFFSLRFDEALAECSSHLPDALIAQCRSYHDEHIDSLRSVDGPCVIHRDFRPGNIIVTDGHLRGIIDWASGCAGFAEEDFGAFEEEWSANSASKKSFLAGYASMRPVPDYRAVMPLLRLFRALATIGFTVRSKTWQGSDARSYQRYRSFLETFAF